MSELKPIDTPKARRAYERKHPCPNRRALNELCVRCTLNDDPCIGQELCDVYDDYLFEERQNEVDNIGRH